MRRPVGGKVGRSGLLVVPAPVVSGAPPGAGHPEAVACGRLLRPEVVANALMIVRGPIRSVDRDIRPYER